MQAEDQELKKEKEQLLAKVEELEEQQKIILISNDMHSQDLRKEHQEKISSLLQGDKDARKIHITWKIHITHK